MTGVEVSFFHPFTSFLRGYGLSGWRGFPNHSWTPYKSDYFPFPPFFLVKDNIDYNVVTFLLHGIVFPSPFSTPPLTGAFFAKVLILPTAGCLSPDVVPYGPEALLCVVSSPPYGGCSPLLLIVRCDYSYSGGEDECVFQFISASFYFFMLVFPTDADGGYIFPTPLFFF